jgi:hypothetical protein
MPSDKYIEYIDEMLLAVQANIDYLRKQGDSQIKIKNGELVNISSENYIYRFELDILQEIDADSDIEIRVNGQSISGKVISITDRHIEISVEANLGEHISEAVLIISNYFLLEKLSERLNQVKNGEVYNSDIAEKILKLKDVKLSYDKAYIIPPRKESLNQSQEEALRLSLGSEVTYIWGPPGTGKTQTIASIIEGFLFQNQSVLLISHTNKATDGAMLKVVKHLEQTDDYREGKFIREGSLRSIDKKLQEKNVVPEKIIENMKAPIIKEMNSLLEKVNILENELSNYHKFIKLKLTLERNEEEQKRLNALLQLKAEEKKQMEQGRLSLFEELKRLEMDVISYQNKNAFRRFFTGTNLNKLTEKKILFLGEKDKLEKSIELISRDVWEIEAKIASIAFKNNSNTQEQSKFTEFSLSDSQIHQKEQEVGNLRTQYDALGQKISDLGGQLIEEAKVVATTLTRSYMAKNILDRQYDCIILDEASMAPIPAVVCGAGLAINRAVIVGDFFQLPPIVKHNIDLEGKSQEEAEKEKSLVAKWLRKDIFDFVGITEDVIQGKNPEAWLTQLNEQYRMHPNISSLVNTLVYQRFNENFKLKDGEDNQSFGAKLLKKEPLANSHLGIYDTSLLGSVPSKIDSGSFYNIPHALLVLELAKQAVDSGYKRIGIISAYRAQVNLINKMLKDEIPEHLNLILAETVHKFQGDEKEIIIFDVTTPKSNSMYDDRGDGGDDMKLLNVAFSRAKEKCIIVADVSAVEKKHSASSLIRGAIDFCRAKKHPFIPCDKVLSSYFADDRTEKWLAQLNNVEQLQKEIENGDLFDESDFYPNYIRDILDAESEVIISSPFITTSRSEKFVPIFSHLLKKGVRIFVITRPSDEHKDAMREQSLAELKRYEKMGIVVIPLQGNIHQKFSIIDRDIMWEGSLNILSQRDSKEVMRRYHGKNAVDQYVAFMRLDKNIGKLGENNLKRCESCKSIGAWYWRKKNRFGKYWTSCLVGFHGVGKKAKPREEIEARKNEKAALKRKIVLDNEGNPICPQHGILCEKKDGYWGSSFWGCPKYKECGYNVSESRLTKYLDEKNQQKII